MPTRKPPRLCVFCGSSDAVDEKFKDAARSFGALLAARGIGVVYGGCKTGLMGAVADGALSGGGEVIGVLPDVLGGRERAHLGLTELIAVPDMHSRKALMTALADAFVALPGCLGTLDEVFEALTWRWIGTHDKPTGLLDVDGYWSHLVAFLDSAGRAGFITPAARAGLLVDSDPAALVAALLTVRPM